MDVLFLNDMDSMNICHEVNGTLLLGTILLNAGFKVDVLRFCEISSFKKDYNQFIKDIVDKIIKISPKVLSIYSLWPDYHIMLRIAKEVKFASNNEIIIAFGGPQATATAEETLKAMSFVDFVCTGEGDNTVVPFFTALLHNNLDGLKDIPGLCYRYNGDIIYNKDMPPLCNLDSLPYWDDRLYLRHYTFPLSNANSDSLFFPIDVGRGCPFSCTFCYTCRFWKRTYRLKSPDRIIAEIRYYMEKFGIHSFRFSHDAFTSNNKLVEEICDRIIDEGLEITWDCGARIDCLTEDLVLKMKKAGMISIQLGVESGSPRMQKLINKNLNLDNVNGMVSFLLKNKISVILFFIFGFPDETEGDLAATLKLHYDLLEMGVAQTSMPICQFSPKSQMTVQYFDQLEFRPDMKLFSRGIFGFQEELDMLADNKALFTFFYHLDTPLRNEFQYIGFMYRLLRVFPKSFKYIRQLYKKDDIRMYRDFVANNDFLCIGDGNDLIKYIKINAPEIIANTIKSFTEPWIPKLIARLKFEHNLWKLTNTKEDLEILETYDFSFIEFQLKIPVEQYSDARSTVLISRIAGKTQIKLLSIV